MTTTGNGLERAKLFGEWLKWLFTIVVSALLAYSAAANTVNQRITVLETQQKTTEQRLTEINQRLETLNTKMDQLLMLSAKVVR